MVRVVAVSDHEDWHRLTKFTCRWEFQTHLRVVGMVKCGGKSKSGDSHSRPPAAACPQSFPHSQTMQFLGYHQQIQILVLITHMFVPKPVGFDSSTAMAETEHVRMIIMAIS